MIKIPATGLHTAVDHGRPAAAPKRLATALALGLATTLSGAALAAKPCAVDSFTPPANATLVSVEAHQGAVNYCRIDGYVTTTDPGPNKVNFMVAMPENHNGRYVFTIQGGAAAFIPDPNEPYLAQGYAVASTDKGVKAAHLLDFSFRDDPAQSLDWAHRGVHVSAVASQDLTRQYYGVDKLHRYAMGCSGGGDGTLSAAETHPEDFDAYVAAAMTTAPLEISLIWAKIAQHIVTNPDGWISPDELQRLQELFMAKYDAADGARDGHIWDPTVIELDREELAFLNDQQFRSLQIIQDGIDEGPDAYYPGFWLSHPSAFARFLFGTERPPWPPGTLPPQSPSGFMVSDTGSKAVRGPDFSYITDFDFNDREQLVNDRRLNMAKGRKTFDPANLKGLQASGGKLLLWSGMAEEAVPPRNILNYTEGANTVFGEEQRPEFIRTFLVPGMFHCVGGVDQPTDVPDVMLEAAARWVEKGEAPAGVVANRRVGHPDVFAVIHRAGVGSQDLIDRAAGELQATPERTFLLCPWPQQSVFKGGLDNPDGLDVKDAANWQCKD